MTVKDVICETLHMVGRHDAVDELNSSGFEISELSAEVARLVRACLTYLNAVCDELARGYFPVYSEEQFDNSYGQYGLENFNYSPIELSKVTDEDGKAVKWRIGDGKLLTSAKQIKVRYAYAPKFTFSEEFSYPHFNVSGRLVEYGILAEYYLVLGDATSSAVWEGKYRNEIENLLSHSTVKERIPPRRWI